MKGSRRCYVALTNTAKSKCHSLNVISCTVVPVIPNVIMPN